MKQKPSVWGWSSEMLICFGNTYIVVRMWHFLTYKTEAKCSRTFQGKWLFAALKKSSYISIMMLHWKMTACTELNRRRHLMR